MKSKILFSVLCLALLAGVGTAQDYTTLEELEAELRLIAAENEAIVSLHSLGTSTSGRDIWYLRIAGEGSVEPDERPALFIGANLEGYRLSATEAALATLRLIIENKDDESAAELLSTRTIYLAPALNPDVMHAFINPPLSGAARTATPVNDDIDDETDEDGAEDLNGDGFITSLRYKHPEGTMIIDPDDERLMKKADPMKGETGEYMVISEGIDNDNDGSFNEDGPGGVMLNMNFPHDFQYFDKRAGDHPVSEPETLALVEFMLSHRTIALVHIYGEESNLLNLKKGKQQGKAGSDMVKVPARFAEFLGLEPEQEIHIDELVEIIKATPIGRQIEITRERVIQFLGAGPAMSIQDGDYAYYEKIAERYKELAEEHELAERNQPPKPVMGDGSFATWAYYHYGVPSFSASVWGLPKLKKEEEQGPKITIAELKEMSSEEFLALGEEKIDAFLKAQGAGDRISARRLMEMVEGGQVNPKMMAQMMEAQAGQAPKKADGEESLLLDWLAEQYEHNGFVAWTAFDHPQLGAVEIGGRIPMVTGNPPYAMLEPALKMNAQFAVELAGKLAGIEIVDAAAKPLSEGVYEVTAYVQNTGFFPTATAQGALNGMAPPVIITLEADGELLGGKPMHRVNAIAGNSRTGKLRWVVKASGEITINARSQKCGSDSVTLTLQ